MSATLIHDVKERLLPLSALEKVLERFIETLPRRNVNAAVVPESEIEVLSEPREEYKAIGKEPHFRLEFSLPPQAGWYYLEAALVRNNGSREAFIEVEAAGGRSEIPIPTNLRGSVREVFYIPSRVMRLYWHPTRAPGYFSQSRLQIHKISSIESFLRRTYRVVYDLWRFRNMQPDARGGLTWLHLFRNLRSAYERSTKLRLQRLNGNDYATFIVRQDTFKETDLRNMQRQVSKLPCRPVFSFVMPLRTADPFLLDASLSALVSQIYPYWELLIVSTLPEGNPALEVARSHAARVRRIKIVGPECFDGIDANIATLLNIGLKAATGAYLARINAHDRLPSHALYWLAFEYHKHPEAELFYSDDDNISSEGTRQSPRFKPDWNPDLLTSHNYIGNLAVFRREKILRIGGYACGYEGAEDYELILRYLKTTSDSCIRHISRVLYHRHVICAEVATNGSAHEAGKRALQRNYHELGVEVEDGPGPCFYRARYPLPAQPPLVSIIVPTRDRVAVLRACVESIQDKTDYPNWELLIVDNQSSERETLAYLDGIQCDRRIRVFRYGKSFNYSAINNYGAQHANGEILALLNNDVEVITKSWLAEMVSHAIRPSVGAVGAKLLYVDGMVQHAGIVLGIGGVAGHVHRYLNQTEHGYCHRAAVTQNYSAVTGACLVVRKDRYEQVGGLNEVNLCVAFNDVDFCLKLRQAGYKNIFTPNARLYHHESLSRGRDDTPQKHLTFIREFEYMKTFWGRLLQEDPAYNPNLSLEFEDFSLAYTNHPATSFAP